MGLISSKLGVRVTTPTKRLARVNKAWQKAVLRHWLSFSFRDPLLKASVVVKSVS